MTVWQLTLHLFNFVLPALGMALILPWLGRWALGRGGGAALFKRMLAHAVAGVMVLALGLVLQGDDGKMSTYMAMVMVAGTLEWVLLRGWRASVVQTKAQKKK